MYISFSIISIISAVLAAAYSSPQNVSATSCTISKYNADDILNAQNDCTEIILNGLNIAAGKTLDLTHLKQGTKVTFQGTTTWEYEEWTGPLIKVSGTDVEITGSSDHVLDGRGNLWWDGLGGNGGKKKPKFITPQKMYNSKITNLNIKNSPVHVFSIKQSDGLTLENINIDDREGDTQGGHNTDGFDIASSNNVVIRHSSVYSQDDCLAVKSGANYEFTDNYCAGGHGISIGSVGDTTVESVYISNCRVEDSANGVRVKTVYGAVGSVSKIIFEDVTLKDITNYGIIIEGDYLNGGPTGTPTDGVPITDLTLKNITGTVLKSGTNVYVLVEAASDWYCSGIDVKGGENVKECQGIPDGSGLSC